MSPRKANVVAVDVDWYESTQLTARAETHRGLLTIKDETGRILHITLGGAVDSHDVGEDVVTHDDYRE